jgi:hypothetical protein
VVVVVVVVVVVDKIAVDAVEICAVDAVAAAGVATFVTAATAVSACACASVFPRNARNVTRIKIKLNLIFMMKSCEIVTIWFVGLKLTELNILFNNRMKICHIDCNN